MKTFNGWVVLNRSGEPLTITLRLSREESIAECLSWARTFDWQECERQGLRVVRVLVSEAERPNAGPQCE